MAQKRVVTLKEELLRIDPYGRSYKEHTQVVLNFYRHQIYPDRYYKYFGNISREGFKGNIFIDQYKTFRIELNLERSYIIVQDLRSKGSKPVSWWIPKNVDHFVELMAMGGFKLYWAYNRVKPYFPHWGTDYEKAKRENNYG